MNVAGPCPLADRGPHGDRPAADEHPGWARNIAVRLAAAGGSRDKGFGPAQIALYETAVSVEASSTRGPRPTGDGTGPGQLHRAAWP
jgi:hypothetical protein